MEKDRERGWLKSLFPCSLDALNKSSDAEGGQWFFQRYIKNSPKVGEVVLDEVRPLMVPMASLMANLAKKMHLRVAISSR